MVEGHGVENDLFAGLDLYVAWKDPDPGYPLLSVLLRLDLRGSGTARPRRALAIPAPTLSRDADARQKFIEETLCPRRPSTRMPPETPILPGVDRRRRDDLGRRL